VFQVTGVGPKAFQQAAGFLRVYGSSEPLDATSVFGFAVCGFGVGVYHLLFVIYHLLFIVHYLWCSFPG
jgi:hypothetical protein